MIYFLRNGGADASPEFEFDEAKSRANAQKHGIDFDEAQKLWADEAMVVAPARDDGEQRFLVVGMIGSTHWSAIVTYRGERVRIISVRRARTREAGHYEGE